MNQSTDQPPCKGHFEISGRNLTDQGVRPLITDKMIREGVKWGSIENIGSKTLIIKLGGTKEEVYRQYNAIRSNFESWLNEGIDERERVRKRIANPGVSFTDFIEDEQLYVLPINLHSHGLIGQQLSKGVDR